MKNLTVIKRIWYRFWFCFWWDFSKIYSNGHIETWILNLHCKLHPNEVDDMRAGIPMEYDFFEETDHERR